jgi:glycosyltransferase involved in cell wall biosynthesis
MQPGVSIIICCHNSAKLLPQTLAHLKAQKNEANVAWEVIVVDNASTDETSRVSLSLWPEYD